MEFDTEVFQRSLRAPWVVFQRRVSKKTVGGSNPRKGRTVLDFLKPPKKWEFGGWMCIVFFSVWGGVYFRVQSVSFRGVYIESLFLGGNMLEVMILKIWRVVGCDGEGS